MRGGRYNLTLLNKQNALYVKACVIVNGVQDLNGDTLGSMDIKRIFSSYNNQDSFELHHNNIPIDEVSLLENYISTNEEVIAGTTIPKGSWNAVIRVDNPEIQQMLKNGDFGGVSLFNRVKPRCAMGLKGEINYSDLKSAECVIPLFISFVKEPANDVGLEILNYDVYIKKSKDGANKMDLLKEIKALVTKAESEVETPTIVKEAEPTEQVEEEPTIVKEEKTEQEEPTIVKESEATEPVKEEPTIVKEAEAEEEAEVQEEDKEEEVIQKEADTEEAEATAEEVEDDTPQEDLKAEIEALKAEIDKINEALAEIKEAKEAVDEEISEEDEEKPVITKSAKITVTTEESKTSNFYEMTGRDPITGKRIRRQTKILN